VSEPAQTTMTVGCAWLLLIGAGLLEIVWAAALKQADGLTRFWPTVIGVTAMVASGVLLTLTLRVLPVGTAYVIWVGIGAVGVAVAGMLAFHEGTSVGRIMCLALILSGVVGLRWLET
jgi:quaternary ammonium compound-resistance protein SugE